MTPLSKNIVLINGPDSKMLIKNEYIYDNQGTKAYNIDQTNGVSKRNACIHRRENNKHIRYWPNILNAPT